MNSLRYKGENVGWVFVDSDPNLNKAIRGNLAWNMVDMESTGKAKRELKYGSCDATIERGNFASMGMFSGPLYKVEIEGDKGHSKLVFMLIRNPLMSMN